MTNIQQLASRAARWLPAFPERYFDLILVDEGHHNVAPSWQAVFERFPEAKVIGLISDALQGLTSSPSPARVHTGTRLRERQMTRGYIRDITSVNVAL